MYNPGTLEASATGTIGRFIGSTSSGPKSTGSWQVGDLSIDARGFAYICTSTGTPGSWERIGKDGFIYAREYDVKNGASASTVGTGLNAASTAAFNAGGGMVLMDTMSVQTNQQIIVKPWVTFAGQGVKTSIEAANCLNVSVFKNYVAAGSESNGQFIGLRDFRIEGNYANQTAGHCVELTMNPLYSQTAGDINYDAHVLLENMFLWNAKQDGYNATGRSENRLMNVHANRCQRYSFRPSFDTFLDTCTSEWAGSNGFQIEESSVRGVDCKSFWSGRVTVDASNGHGYYFANGQGGINFSGSNEAQDNSGSGIALNNCRRAVLTGFVFDENSNGHVHAGVTAGQYPAVDVYDSTDFIVEGVCYTRKAYDSTSYQTRALRMRHSSTGNTIRLKHSATTYNGAAIGSPIMSGDAEDSYFGNTLEIMNDQGTQVIASSSSIAVNPYLGGRVVVQALATNTTIANPSDGHDGQILSFVIRQDATGTRTITMGSAYKGALSTIDVTANGVSSGKYMKSGTDWLRCS